MSHSLCQFCTPLLVVLVVHSVCRRIVSLCTVRPKHNIPNNVSSDFTGGLRLTVACNLFSVVLWHYLMQSPSKLPPVSRVSRRPNTRAPPKHFAPVTPADVKARQHVGDAKFTGPMFPANLEPGRTLASIPISYALPEDDEAAADSVAEKQIKIGDRVLVRRKRMRK